MNTKRLSSGGLIRVASALAWLVTGGAVQAQMVQPESLPQGFVIVVEDQSQAATADKPIFMASGASTWNPGDPAWVLSPRSDKRWQIVIEPGRVNPGVEFKFTLGSWSAVETTADGQDIDNRKLPLIDAGKVPAGEKPVIELTIPRFRDGSEAFVIAPEYRPLEVTGTVKRLQVAGGAGAAEGKMRDLLVWLPPGYDQEPERTYPVLYMLDGQNLFQKQEGAPAEWRMDEIAGELIAAGEIEPLIVVGIPSLAAARASEYVPRLPGQPATLLGQPALGDDFTAWLADEVFPRVERAFRVSTDRGQTGIGGASLGGLAALHAAYAMPERFGLVLAESPALAFDTPEGRYSIMPWLEERVAAGAPRMNVFIGMGGAEDIPGSGFFDKASRAHVKAAEAAYELLGKNGVAALDVIEGHGHDETAWSQRLPGALKHLFPGPAQGQMDGSAVPKNAAPLPAAGDRVRIIVTDAAGDASGESPVHLASSTNQWNPGDETRRMRPRGSGEWAIEVPAPAAGDDPVEFKFALGSWDRVELAEDGSHTANRVLDLASATRGEDGVPELRFTVPRFAEAARLDTRNFDDPARPLEVTGRVDRLAVRGGAGRAAGLERQVLVWLPAGYDEPANAQRRYPVLYLLDGQNVFERAPGVPGEWGADETATRLIEAGEMEPLIIVAVPNARAARADEYIPAAFGTLRGAQPEGERFAVWVKEAVRRLVNLNYRTDNRPERTAIGGASLGGLAALYAAVKFPDAFGVALIESCSMLTEDGAAIEAWVRAEGEARPHAGRYLIGMGGQELGPAERDQPRNRAYVAWATRLAEALKAGGASENRVEVRVVEAHRHNELAWGERLAAAMPGLFAER